MVSWTDTQEPIDWGIVGAWLVVFIGCAGFWASWAVLLVLALS